MTSESTSVQIIVKIEQLHENFVEYFSSVKFDANQKRKGRTIDWQDLYFPIGCGMMKGGVPANTPLAKQSDGSYAPVRFCTLAIVWHAVNLFKISIKYLIEQTNLIVDCKV